MRHLFLILSFGFIFVSCSDQKSTQLGVHNGIYSQNSLYAPSAPGVPLTKQQWIAKAAKVLRYGHGLSPADDMNKLMTMSKEEIVDSFMNDPRFSDTVLDFNLYFLGFRFDNLKKRLGPQGPYAYAPDLYVYSAAIESAKAVAAGGDFLSLLNYKHPFYMNPLEDLKDPNDPNVTPEQYRSTKNTALLSVLDQIIVDIKAGLPNQDRTVICKTWDAYNPESLINLLQWPADIDRAIFKSPAWFNELASYCQNGKATIPATLLDDTVAMKGKVASLIQALDTFTSSQYKAPKTLNEIRVFPSEKFAFDDLASPFPFRVWQKDIPNSSTNQNRKRASFILKRYFCDDLTPIGIVQPAGGGHGVHGTDPSCIACHFKLDPMAGFFRDRGVAGYDFTGNDNIQFDDNFKTKLSDYEQLWKAPSGSNRVWDVGYVRSLDYPEHNDYRSTLPELFDLIRQAPEVKKCLVRRAFEYVHGENQVFDSGYLDSLTDTFNQGAQSNSSKAFKDLLKSLVLNKTFGQSDVDSNGCYDYAPGVDPAGRPPCRVATVIEHNCASCHKGADSKGDLDLSSWKQIGNAYGFTHEDASGHQVDPKQTFKEIVERLETPDATLRMPLDKYMEDLDRVELVKWAEGMEQ